jgi:hypothetical protein
MTASAAGADTGKIYDRMLKCLELTASDNDAEALLAIRKANELRAKLGLRWALPLQAPPGAHKPSAPPPPDPEPEPDADEYDYDAVFAAIWKHGTQSEKWAAVLKNIEEYWGTVGKLSPKQHNLVMKFYESAMEAQS